MISPMHKVMHLSPSGMWNSLDPAVIPIPEVLSNQQTTMFQQNRGKKGGTLTSIKCLTPFPFCAWLLHVYFSYLTLILEGRNKSHITDISLP